MYKKLRVYLAWGSVRDLEMEINPNWTKQQIEEEIETYFNQYPDRFEYLN